MTDSERQRMQAAQVARIREDLRKPLPNRYTETLEAVVSWAVEHNQRDLLDIIDLDLHLSTVD